MTLKITVVVERVLTVAVNSQAAHGDAGTIFHGFSRSRLGLEASNDKGQIRDSEFLDEISVRFRRDRTLFELAHEFVRFHFQFVSPQTKDAGLHVQFPALVHEDERKRHPQEVQRARGTLFTGKE